MIATKFQKKGTIEFASKYTEQEVQSISGRQLTNLIYADLCNHCSDDRIRSESLASLSIKALININATFNYLLLIRWLMNTNNSPI
jgi:hypothetical protein